MNMTSAPSSVHEYPVRETPAQTTTPNANTAYIAITALVVIGSVCILLMTGTRPDLWPTVAMIGSICIFGALMSFFVTRTK